MKNFRKVVSIVVPLAMMFSFFNIQPNFANAANTTFAITGNPAVVTATATGFEVSLSGTATITNPKGDNYGVSVIWGTGTACVPATYNFTGNPATTAWSASKVLTTPGTYTITALVHHSQCSGAESADATITFTATIPPEICLDGIDNDFDLLADLADPDCAPYFPSVTVNKVVVNDNGGTKQSSDFSLFVDSTPVTSGQTISVMPGVHTVSETIDPGYTKTGITGACASNGTFNAVAGLNQNYTCTITNNDIQNLPPIAPDAISATTPEMLPYTFIVNTTDPENDPITFSLLNAPTGASITTGGMFSWTPTEAQGPGSYLFTLRVSDNHSNYSDAPISINVTEVNNTPTVSPQSVSLDEDGFVDVTLSASDSDLPAQTLTFSVTQGAHGTVTLLGNIATYTPALNYNGPDSFTYTANDGVTNSAGALVSITVNSVNDAPSLAPIDNVTIPELTPFTFTASSIDIDNGSLTYTITTGATGATINSATGVFTWTPAEDQGPGSYPFTVEVSDGTSADAKSFTINVTEVNQAPVLATIGNKSGAEEGTISFTISATDADVPANTLTFSATDLPTGATFDTGTQTFSWTPTFEQSGNYQITFTVSDGVTTDFEVVPFDIGNVNRTPTLDSIGDKNANEGDTVSFTVSGSDPDSDTLDFSATDLPTGASFNDEIQTFSWATGFEDSGVYTVKFEVTDGDIKDEETIMITVNNVNRAPVAVNQSLTLDEDSSTSITIIATDVDIPAQTLAYAITSSPLHGNLSDIDLSAGTMTYTPNANFNGTDTFTFSATDATVSSNTATVSITVASINDTPTITLNGSNSIAITEGGTYVEAGAVCSDVEDGSPTVVINGSVNTNTPGQYTLTYDCTDASDVKVSVTRTVDVQAKPAQCMDGIDNDQDGKIDFPADGGCTNTTDNNETDPVIMQCADGIDNDGDGKIDMNDGGCESATDNDETNTSPSRHGSIPQGGSSTVAPAGQVLGASTTCGIYVDKFLRRGYKNDMDAVKKVQQFLNNWMKAGIKEDGKFGAATEKWVKKFQLTNKGSVLSPWKLKAPTGIFYITTQTEVNKIMCPELNLTTPTLIPIEKNPLAPKKS